MKHTIIYRFLITYIFVFVSLLSGTEHPETAGTAIIKAGTISGKVLDAATHQPLSGVNIIILNSTLGAYTDNEGNFTISNIPTGNTRVIVSYMGYEPQRQAVLVEHNKTSRITFRMDQDILDSSAIVVTGTSTPYLYEEAPVKTEVITQRLIQQTQSCNLAEAMALQTGVRVENNCQNCNFTQVRILGFDGKYSQVLIDGDPVVSTLAGVYALEQFPDEMIGQIEIVKGGGSALYGSGAMADTINLRTRQPNMNRSRITYDLQSLSGALDNRVGMVAELLSNDGRTGAFIYGSTRQRDHYDHNGDRFNELGTLNNESIGMNWYYRPMNQTELKASRIAFMKNDAGAMILTNPFMKPISPKPLNTSAGAVKCAGLRTLIKTGPIKPIIHSLS
ncbi:MAG: TonB-dependent receptor plug domain-containing protein [Caldithrix sp.]|nr:TonB-dependent receptor plug domain-containing protein [Caldithrix sp.]